MQTIAELEKEIELMRIEWVLNYCANNGIIINVTDKKDLLQVYSTFLFKERIKNKKKVLTLSE